MSKDKKKGSKPRIKDKIARIGATLGGMVTPPDSKKSTGIPRAEVAAISFGLSVGLGVGAMLQVDDEFSRLVLSEEPIESAARFLGMALEDWPKHKAEILSKGWEDVKCAAAVGVVRDGR